MLARFQQHIEQEFPFILGKKILIAISGGIDSVVLAHLFDQVQLDVSFAHCNFKLRDEDSDQDEVFVTNLAKDLGILTHTKSFNTQEYATKNKTSIQIAARDLRYNWFQELANTHSYNFIATAHHADDNLETFFINLSRGTGLEGLTGIPSINNNIIRPLLPFSREEIEQYAIENNITWSEDKSNADTKYLRNKIRHQLTPILKEINPNFIHSFNKTSTFLTQAQQIVDDKVEALKVEICSRKDDYLRFDIEKIKQLSNPKAYLYQILKSYDFTEWTDVYKLLTAQSGKQIATKNHILLKDRDFLLLLRTGKISERQDTQIIIDSEVKKITKPIQLSFEHVLKKSVLNKNIIYVDKKSLNFPLYLRKWRTGDYFYPAGMKGKKKLSKYFKDEKIPIFEKQNIWLLCTSDDKIIWVVGKRQDNRFLPHSKTTELIQISI
ncbi:potassium ABC transporter ATPase [Tenacibaculum holothuriorum]|uniref:tRNA(Ile)-lysidine synthase n=1 Tax=Tenacibaculum holothuriorum TaxID=1635173 RepID=A0A1Y2PB32_9FLAO|nr:tRNA lysidine(34) synthetase TilS [Tenacibaculum holothuriorum]OSY86969.1 potassium ABC transporter ATPase [Tenacibaculum holothuriorum]